MFVTKRLNDSGSAQYGAKIAGYLPGRTTSHRTLPEGFSKGFRIDCKSIHKTVIFDSIRPRREPRRCIGPLSGGVRTRIQEHWQTQQQETILPVVLPDPEKSLFYPSKEKTSPSDIIAVQHRRRSDPNDRRRHLVRPRCGNGTK